MPVVNTSLVPSRRVARSHVCRHVVRYTRPCNQCSDRNTVDNRIAATTCSLQRCRVRGVDKSQLSSEECISRSGCLWLRWQSAHMLLKQIILKSQLLGLLTFIYFIQFQDRSCQTMSLLHLFSWTLRKNCASCEINMQIIDCSVLYNTWFSAFSFLWVRAIVRTKIDMIKWWLFRRFNREIPCIPSEYSALCIELHKDGFNCEDFDDICCPPQLHSTGSLEEDDLDHY